MKRIWHRIGAGKTTALVGERPSAPPDDIPVRVLAIDCQRFPQPMGPLLALKREAEQYLGETRHPLLDAELDPDRAALRRRLFGDLPDPERGGALVQALNRLHARVGSQLAIALLGVDRADAATLGMLARIVARKDWLKPPLLLVYDAAPDGGPAATLLETVERAEGVDAVVAPERARVPSDAARRPQPVVPQVDAATLLVLRAAATASEAGRFDASLVAALLERPLLEVLYSLQYAVDAGVAVQDFGEGQFGLDAETADALQAGVVPSLLRLWHARLARLLGTSQDGSVPARTMGADPRRESDAQPPLQAIRPEPIHRREPAPRPPAAPHASAAATDSVPPSSARPPERVPMPAAPERHESKAGQHHEAAGESELAATQYLEAARKAALSGAPERALELIELALGALDPGPVSSRSVRLQAEALCEAGAIQWRAVGPGETFTLQSALESLERARSILGDFDALETRDASERRAWIELGARIGATLGGVHYDIGDADSLERSLHEFSSASKRLLDAGLPREAARLLNDEAAVWVRIGDPVRANHLLQKSRELFRELLPDDGARLELAETEHLLGRLILHVPARPQREESAYRLGHEYCLSAADAFRDLGHHRELARVWDTLGRLERRAGHPDRAVDYLTQAARVQQQLGDAMGLASSTAALAEVLADAGQLDEALATLAASVELNLDKGSRRGLSYNTETLDSLEKVATADERPPPERRQALLARLASVRQSLDEAERVLATG